MKAVAPKKNYQKRFRRIVFTVNNYSEEEYKLICEEFAPTTKWLIVGKEVAPTTGKFVSPMILTYHRNSSFTRGNNTW